LESGSLDQWGVPTSVPAHLYAWSQGRLRESKDEREGEGTEEDDHNDSVFPQEQAESPTIELQGHHVRDSGRPPPAPVSLARTEGGS